jgi:uncharacterized protein YjeT (DUF2065 family)
MSEFFWGALALMLIFEGILPFVSPAWWRKAFERALQLTDGQLRFVGLASMVAGLVALLLLWP